MSPRSNPIGLTYYDSDRIDVIQEKDSTDTVTDRQVHGYAPIPSMGDIALMDKGGGSTYVPISDQVGTVWVLLDSTGAVANSYSYDAFGVGGGVTETIANRYRFGTKRLDADSGLYHFIARRSLFVRRAIHGARPIGRWCRIRLCQAESLGVG